MSEATIPITSEIKFNIQIGDALTQNVKPLLHEIKHALAALIKNGETKIIDLRSIPLAPGEEDKILITLGQGEVQAQMHTLGLSEVIETQFVGVWVVTHYNDEGNTVSRFIEITTMPDILKSQFEDLAAAHQQITETIEKI